MNWQMNSHVSTMPGSPSCPCHMRITILICSSKESQGAVPIYFMRSSSGRNTTFYSTSGPSSRCTQGSKLPGINFADSSELRGMVVCLWTPIAMATGFAMLHGRCSLRTGQGEQQCGLGAHRSGTKHHQFHFGSSSRGRMVLRAENGPKSDAESEYQQELAKRIKSGEFTVMGTPEPVKELRSMRQFLLQLGPFGRAAAKPFAAAEREWRLRMSKQMPQAAGDVRAVVGQPFFVPLYDLFRTYGGVFRLTFGPKSFVIVSDSKVAKHILKDNAKSYSKGILTEILKFVMGTGLIPADGEVWRVRRRAVVPALHRKYVEAMVNLFGTATARLCDKIDAAANNGEDVEMESLFSHLTLDIIGKAVFNYDFNSLSTDTGIVEAVYVALREAEERSTAVIPYWDLPFMKIISPRQRKVQASLKLVNDTLDDLISICKRMVDEENTRFHEEYISDQDPSILHFLLASGDEVNSQQLRDDLMTLLIAGHETSAAVLTWAFYLLAQNPTAMEKLQKEVDTVLGDKKPTIEDMKKLRYTTRVINETLRLYPEPPVLIRRALRDDMLGNYMIREGTDIFISVWNLHRDPSTWERADEFWPERWPLDGPDPTEVTENFRYLPFGGGPRKCIGDMFATFENITAIAMLVRRFDFQLSPTAPAVGMTTGATIHTTSGLVMTPIRRNTRPVVIPVTEPTMPTSLVDEQCQKDDKRELLPRSSS